MSASEPKPSDPTGRALVQADSPARLPSSPKQAAPPRECPAAPINALAILNALRRRWLAAAVLGALAAGVAFAAVWFFMPPPDYAAYAMFRIPSKPEGTLFDHPEAKFDFEPYKSTQLATLTSHIVLNAAVRRPEVAKLPDVAAVIARGQDPVDWLEKQVHTDFPSGRELLRVTVYSADDKTCKTLVTAVKDVYLEEVANQAKKRRQDRLDELDALTAKYEAKVKTLRETLHAQAQTLGGGNDLALMLKQMEAHEQGLAARRELTAVEIRKRDLEAEKEFLNQHPSGPGEVPAATLNAFVDRRPEVAALLAQQADLEKFIAENTSKVVGGENSPLLRPQVEKLQSVAKDLETQRAALREEAKKLLLAQAVDGAEKQSTLLKEQIDAATARAAKLKAEIQELAKEAQDFNEAVVQFDDLKPQIVEAEGVAMRAAEEHQKLAIEKLDPLRVTPWEGGEVLVSRPDEATRKLSMAGLGAAGAFCVAALLVGFLEFRARRINAPRDVARSVGLPVVGTLPARPYSRKAAGDPAWHALLAESVDSARTMLLHGGGPEALRVVMVTSAVGGEAKTSLAGHLAVSLARSGRKTLLIDGDLRSPSVHKLFDLPTGPGLSELLRGEALIPDVLSPAGVPGLQVIGAGDCDPLTLSQLSQGIFEVILGRLRESFDFIVLDSSPVLPVTDALLMARHVDGVLLSVLQNVSTLPALHEAYVRLSTLGVAMLGAVVSGARGDVASYGGRRYLALAAPAQ